MQWKMKFNGYLLGCFLFSIGAKLFILSNLGVDPLDCLVLGIVKHLGFKIGTVSGAIAIVFLGIWSLWNRRKPLITPFLTMTIVGYLIDFWNYLLPNTEQFSFNSSFMIMVSGLICCAYASSLIIMSGVGIRIMDLVAITMMQKLNMKFYIAKSLLEVFFIVSGFLLGGPFGIGTFGFLLIVGPLIQPFIMLNERFRVKNYGFSKNPNVVIQLI